MQTIPGSKVSAPNRSTKQFKLSDVPAACESKAERVERIYKSPGGPVLGWLLDEAYKRGDTLNKMAAEIGVTYGYINQLRSGIRSTEHLSQGVCDGMARYLGTCTIVVKLLANQIKLSDFLWRPETEEAAIDRAVREIQDDPKIRQAIPFDLQSLPLDAKRTLVVMYSEVTSHDPFDTRQLPNILFWLQRAAVTHDENEFEAKAGHRDTSAGMKSPLN